MINENKHIKNLLIWIHDEVCSAGGDGDAWWHVSDSYKLEDIFELVKEVNETELGLFKWKVSYNAEKSTIMWGKEQEGAVIFQGENIVPSWAQCVITL